MHHILSRVVAAAQPKGPVPPDLAPRLLITNLLVFLGLGLVLFFSIIQAIGGYFSIVAENQIATVMLATIYLLVRRGRHLSARILFLLFVNGSLLGFSYVLGAQIGLKLLFYPLIVVPLVLFAPRERVALVSLCGVSMAAAIFVNAYGAELMPGTAALDAAMRETMQITYAILAPLALVVPTWILLRFMERYERDKMAEQALVIQTGKLRALGHMAGGLAHEINNPLSVVLGYTRMLREAHDRDDADLSRKLDTICNSAERIAKVVRGFLNVSRDGASGRLQVIDLSTFVRDTADFCGEQFRSKDVQLRLQPRLGETWVKGDRLQLTDVLLSLLRNSLDAVAGKPERWVDVAVGAASGRAYLSVTDSGPGIAAAIRDRIMEPFFTTKEVGSGAGLGLSLAHASVVQLGGRLYLDEAAPHTRFVIELPLAVGA